MDRKVLMMSPGLDLHGGNLVTVSRIRDQLKKYGYHCELSSPKAFVSLEAFGQKVKEENIQNLIGIHAHKTGIFMNESGLPFILIIGGTDVNIYSEDPKKLAEMSQVVRNARYVVCFSPELKLKVEQLWPGLDNRKLKVVRQGIELHLPSEMISEDVITKRLHDVYNDESRPAAFQGGEVKPIVFTLIGGMRPVKNPLYLVSAFQDWHARDERIWFLVVGQVLDQSYTDTQFLPAAHSKLGVLFIPGVSLSEAHIIMKQSFALVNSSDNEGMCLAILEAMKLGVPVLARDNLGNRSIVDDGNTGLLFTSPQTFIQKAERLIDQPKERARLVCNAQEFVTANHRLDSESAAYIDMVKQCLSENIAHATDVLTDTVCH